MQDGLGCPLNLPAANTAGFSMGLSSSEDVTGFTAGRKRQKSIVTVAIRRRVAALQQNWETKAAPRPSPKRNLLTILRHPAERASKGIYTPSSPAIQSAHLGWDDTMRKFLIAETDESGCVEWVWVSRGDTRKTRPLDRTQPLPFDLDDCEIAGASRAAVQAWLQTRS